MSFSVTIFLFKYYAQLLHVHPLTSYHTDNLISVFTDLYPRKKSTIFVLCQFFWVSRYRWLCYINPNYYGFSASAFLLLSGFESECERNGGSAFECYTSSGEYILRYFAFSEINPYQNIMVSAAHLFATVQTLPLCRMYLNIK